MRVLAITNIFPNAQNPSAAPYNRQQFAALTGHGCSVEVLATIPWFPGAARLRPYTPHVQDLTTLPREEIIDGLRVRHPRTLYLPKLTGTAGPLFAASLLPKMARYRGKVDVVLSAWAYPDGWASVLLGRVLGVPTVVKLHGSDINVTAQQPAPRRLLRWVLPHTARVVAVSRELATKTAELGVDPARIDIVYDGVDANTFRVRDRAEARAELGRDPSERMVVFVGNLLRTKGAVDLLEAFEQVARTHPSATAVMIGRGPSEAACRAVASRLGTRVTFTGPQMHDRVARWITASDVLALPSWNEGTPNVVLEALACGRRVLASDVGGIPDLLTSRTLGEMVAPRDIPALAAALARTLTEEYDPVVVAREGQRGTWSDSAAHLRDVLDRAVG